MMKDRLRRKAHEESLGLRPKLMIEGLDHPKANPGITLPWLIGLILKLLGPIMKALTPTLREALEGFLLDYYEKAAETDNPWDDFLALFLLNIFGIKAPE